MPNWERLSALDASFLNLEDANTHMHVAAVLHCTGGSLMKDDGTANVPRVRQVVASKLHLVPRMRSKLAFVPYEKHPVWIDDATFDIAAHVRSAKLRHPGSARELRALCGQLLSRPLDRDKPMWELWIADGYADGGLVMMLKAHHCMIDGIGGTDLLMALCSPFQAETVEAPAPWRPRRAPTDAHLAAEALTQRISGPWKLLGESRRKKLSAAQRLQEATGVVQGLAESAASAVKPASKTPLNGLNGPHRNCAWAETDLAAVKAVAKATGCKVNDVVLATVAGALERYFKQRNVDPTTLDVRALVPVNSRAADDRSAGNRVASMIAPLPMHGRSPLSRLRKMARTMQGVKDGKQAAGVEHLETIANFGLPALITHAMRLSARLQMYNLIVTNVPGPQMPLYFHDAELQSVYPFVPLFRNQGLGLALISYNGKMYWGLQGDRRLLHDLDTLPGHLTAAFAELRDAALAKDARRDRASRAADTRKRAATRP